MLPRNAVDMRNHKAMRLTSFDQPKPPDINMLVEGNIFRIVGSDSNEQRGFGWR